ncbi:IS110 family transposase [Sinanaerobacter chloroacetimidivorans]|uniref:IS110 family transposase n=1 Tax=Sinanaerobacter chloroacetimidivorans TaxID=2818044 RepID=A0A8J8B3A2_9FIRM|nr:IS110 family transposase [Sinanaerobacter chloroacetimidivorans]MBR0600653.1 IS110 family transposase [Sinanaerobacter chloroacetimidivorans]
MIYAGIDVAKDKHDCLIVDSDGVILFQTFTIPNNKQGFGELLTNLKKCGSDSSKMKVGLEATGHYSDNLLEFLIANDLPTTVINPLHTNLYRKSLSLRKTKTDKVDAHSIVTMLRTESLKPYSQSSYHVRELKSLTRYRFSLVQDCARLKTSYARLCVILFPELEKLVSSLHMVSTYALLSELPNAGAISQCHLTRLSNLLSTSSKGRYGKEKAVEIRNAAKDSIGSYSDVKSLELQQTIQMIRMMEDQIKQIEAKINPIVDELHSPIMTIPGISYRMAAIIIAETENFSNFNSAEKVLAFAGLEPSVYQSGQLTSTHSKMVKRGSKYLRYALFNATKYVCHWDAGFSQYLAKKRSEGKAYNVAVSHATKKLTRVIFHLVKTNQPFASQV